MGEERNWHERERTGREAFFFLMDKQTAGGFSRNPATRRPWKHDKLGIVEDHKVQRPEEDMIYPGGNKELKIRIRHAQRIHLAAEKHS
jgi:hypothetical protein